MITHQNHKFIYNGIAALALPNGMCVNYDCEGMSQDTFELISPDGGFRLVVEFYNSAKSPRRDLGEWCYSNGHEVTSAPQAITTPTGLAGSIAKFTVGNEHYEECTLSLVGDERCNFWLMHETGKPYDEAHYERVKAEVLENIKTI